MFPSCPLGPRKSIHYNTTGAGEENRLQFYYYWLSQFEIKVVKNKAARRQLSSSTSITYVCKVCKTNLSRRRWYMFKVDLKRSSEEIIRQDRKIASLLHNDTKKLIYCKHFLIRISKIFFGKYLFSKNLWNFFRSQTVSLVQCATLQKSIETPLCSNGYAECCFQSFATQGYSITTVIPIHSIHKARKQGLYKKKVDNWHNFCT